MVAPALDTVRIQNKLVDLALAGPFYKATYNAATKYKSVDTTTPVAPVSVLANEIASTFDVSPTNRRGFQEDRVSWSWILKLEFNVEVSGEAFEALMLSTPIFLPRDATHARQVRFKITRSTLRHPTTQNPQTGTQVDYAFEVQLSPA